MRGSAFPSRYGRLAPERARGAAAEAGFVLPIVLLLLLAASGPAVVALLVARSEVALESADFRYLGERLDWEATLDRPDAHVGPAGPGPDGLHRRPLGGGFLLLRSGNGPAVARQAVVWALDPDTVLAALPPAAEVGFGIPESGVEWGDEACGPAESEPLVRVRPAVPIGAPEPPPDLPPRLGPVGLERLLARALPFAYDDPLSWTPTPALVRVPAGTRLDAGEGHGILLAAGDLVLTGDLRWIGLVLVERDLELEGTAVLEGAALVGERLLIRDQARLVACRSAVHRALGVPVLEPSFPVRGGRSLGRF